MVSCWSVGFEHLFLVLFLTLILIASKYFCYAWCVYVHTMSLYQMQFCNPLHGLWKYTYWLTDCTTNALDLVQRERDRVFDTNTVVCVWHLHLIFCVCVLRRCTSLWFTSPQTHTHTHCLRSSHGGELTRWPCLITPQQLPYSPCSTPKAPGPPPAPTHTLTCSAVMSSIHVFFMAIRGW